MMYTFLNLPRSSGRRAWIPACAGMTALLFAANLAEAKTDSQSTQAYQHAMESMHHRMHIPYTGDPDIDFVTGMIPHHQGAIDMARIELQYGADPEMRWLARWIIQEQQLEIGQMQAWLRGRANPNVPHQASASTDDFKQSMETMHHAMMIDYTGIADIDFARGMIPHHQGAVDMAAMELHYGMNLDMHHLAETILTGQEGEIVIMQQWLKKHISKGS